MRFGGGRWSGGVGGGRLFFGLFVGFDEPEVHVRAAGDFGKDVCGVGVFELGRGDDGGADEFAVEGDFMGEFGHVFSAAVDGGGVLGETGGFGDDADAAMGDAAELDDAFGDGVDVADSGVEDFVEQFVEGDEVWAFDVPVGLFGEQHEVDGVGEALLQEAGHFETDLLGEAVAGVREFCFHHPEDRARGCGRAMG